MLPDVTCPVHTARRAGQRTLIVHENHEQYDLICHGHGIQYAYGLVDQGDDKRVEITKKIIRKNKHTCGIYRKLFKMLRTKNEHHKLLESRIEYGSNANGSLYSWSLVRFSV